MYHDSQYCYQIFVLPETMCFLVSVGYKERDRKWVRLSSYTYRISCHHLSASEANWDPGAPGGGEV